MIVDVSSVLKSCRTTCTVFIPRTRDAVQLEPSRVSDQKPCNSGRVLKRRTADREYQRDTSFVYDLDMFSTPSPL